MIETVLTLVSLTALYFIFFINGKRIGYSKGWEDGYEDGKNWTYELLNILDDDRIVYVVRSRGKVEKAATEDIKCAEGGKP